LPEIRCETCGNPYPDGKIIHVCDTCRGYFDFDSPPLIDLKNIDPLSSGMWKYRQSFSLKDPSISITLGEGDTPFFWDDAMNIEIGFKLESMNPTGSYKDRGTAVLVSQLAAYGVKTAVEDSSGNAGASFAAYCARAGIKARVFVPESASGPKRRQIEQYGAELISIPGPRSEAAKAVLRAVETGEVYGSHAFLPFGIPGIASIAYELLEQTKGRIGTVIAPAGHGALLLGIMRGFEALQNAGKIKNIPYMVGVQAENCSPMAQAFSFGLEKLTVAAEGNTIAEGVRVSRPVRARAILNEMQPGKGEIVSIPEEEIIPACSQLAGKGIYAEPTSALAWAALRHVKKELPRPIILIISGNGLKYYPT
jgi:threonine synthase